MEIGKVLRDKRKSLKLTQEQVANHLGITAPAVNKWEKGLSCPDITLLPMLARLLKTDPNTLLCFNENLSDCEINSILGDINQTIKTLGFKGGYDLALEKIREYPHCSKLKYNITLVLDGAILFSNPDNYPSIDYTSKIDRLYEEVAESDDEVLVNNARFMLVGKYLQRTEFDKAQTLLDLMPQKSSIPDKQILQTNLLTMQGKDSDAATILERMALSSLSETLMAVTKLIPILISENNLVEAQQLAKSIKLQYEVLGLWNYSACLPAMQLAIASKDIDSSILMISEMLNACISPWDGSNCPLYMHQPLQTKSENMGSGILPSLLFELEHSDKYEFLRSSREFCELIERYKQNLL